MELCQCIQKLKHYIKSADQSILGPGGSTFFSDIHYQ